jgi:3D (Asp-Asp-Asp) domain-containing protein
MWYLTAGLCLGLLLMREDLGLACPGLPVTLTAYAAGLRTASGRRPGPGTLALSRDVERLLGSHFGDQVTLEGLGVFVFQDRMPGYWRRRVDLYLPPRTRALHFGKRHGVVHILPSPCP